MLQSQVVLVGGGKGFVGSHLVNLLRLGGARVRVVTRRPDNAGASDQISWDAIRSKGLPSGTTTVINLAGRNILEPGLWTNAYKSEVYSSRIETNKLLADAINAATNKPNAFLTVSGVGYYPASDSITEFDEDWHQEAHPDQPRGYLAQLARDWEEASRLNEETAAATRRVIIRPGVVVGPDGGIIKNMTLPFKLGLGGAIGNGQQWMPWIHVADLASMFKFSMLNQHVEGVVNGVAPEQVRNEQFAREFAKSLSRPSVCSLPGSVVNLMFGSERAAILLQGQRVKSRAGLLGFRYKYPTLERAIAACAVRA